MNNSRKLRAMILAAGAGTRLGDLTLDRPKPLVPVGGRPVLEYTIDWLRYFGTTEIAINTHYYAEKIPEHFGDGEAFGVTLRYSHERALLGTAGGVMQMASWLGDPFIVVYGDVLTDLELSALVCRHLNDPIAPVATIAAYRVENPSECGVLQLDRDSRIRGFIEKPREVHGDALVNAGVMVLSARALRGVPEQRPCDFGRDIFPRLVNAGAPMVAWPLPDTAYLIDMGTARNFERAKREWPTARAKSFTLASNSASVRRL